MKTESLVKKLGLQLFFTGPTLVAFGVTILLPFLYGLYLTFLKMENVTSVGEFAWFNNYVLAFQDDKFWTSLWLTIQYVVYTVIFVNLLGFGMAFLVTAGTRGQNFFRAALFMPNMIGGIVLGYIWQFIFVKLLPNIGEALDVEYLKYSFLGDETQAFFTMVIVTVWQSAGYMMIIFIAGLLAVPRDLIEASMIDGANAWQRLKAIILPLMVPAFLVTIFLTLRNSFLVFDLNYSLTGGEPYNSTELISMLLVNKAFGESSNYGVAQSEAIILFVVVAAIAWIQFHFGKRREVEA
jgi:raffinose/stachyose/melibiose transport system permease protein